MRQFLLCLFLMFNVLLGAQTSYDVSSGTEFYAAQEQASAGDTIAWTAGVYADTRMDLNKDGLIVTAEQSGTVLFTGFSRVVINANNITFSGFQYVGGSIGNLDVIRIYGSDVICTQINIQNYTCFKYLRVYEESRRCTISYCNFENRLNLDDQNILSILVDDEPGYHKIQYCSFKNFDGIGNDQGIEPIRIGVSSQGDLDSRTLVEYCYFTMCNGDGEIISHKSRQNVYRYNTFENNPVAELVLRHGDEGIVYGNFFINNMGGVRVREGSHHYIYNNYFEGLDRRSIFLQNDPADPLSDIHIYHNTIVNSEEARLGGSGSNPPANVVLANNVFTDPKDQSFREDTGNEIWVGNFAEGDLGIDLPTTGILVIDPELQENTAGFFQPEEDSPVIASASADYPMIPLFEGMDYDNEMALDLMRSSRPAVTSDRAVGASEYSSVVQVQPHVTETNTGPAYLFDNLVDYVAANASQLYIGKEGDSKTVAVSSNIDWTVTSSTEWISTDLEFGTGDSQVIISIDANSESVARSGTVEITGGAQTVSILVFQDAGDPVSVLDYDRREVVVYPNPTDGQVKISNLPKGTQKSFVEILDVDGSLVLSSAHDIRSSELTLDVAQLSSGTYILNIKFLTQSGAVNSESSQTLIKK